METTVDTQMNGHIANGDVVHEERSEMHTTSTTEVTTSSEFMSSDSQVISSEHHMMSEEHTEYREDTQSQASEEFSEADVYEQGYHHGYHEEADEQPYEREGSPSTHERSYEREGSPNVLNRSYEREGSPASHDRSYEMEGSADEQDSGRQKAHYDSSNDSFGSHEPQSWHEHQVATSPPQSLRIEDTLPEFQPSKRYVKPEEKTSSKAPGLMIMEAKDRAPAIHDRDPPSEYEIKPSQPFGSLASKFAEKGAMGDMMCQQCGKRVYEMEKIIADQCVYHKMCFKCQHCKRVLSLGNFASIDKQLYCKPHFIEIFKTRGNYDEGFGVERKVYHRDSKEHIAPIAVEENNLQASTEVETKISARAEEKVDEGLGNLPSIKSIKNRFETPEPQAPPAPTGNRSRKSSDRSVDSSSVNGDARGYRKSKWDRPKEPPPPPVNRTAEGDQLQQNEEVTSSESTKLLVSRFREIERGDNATYQSERKPVHKITPPRDELARGIEEAERIYQEEETTVQSERRQEDLPPPSITKNKLAIFRSMEEDSQAPPSPARSSYSTTTVTRTQHSVTTHSHIKASPDSGISDSEQQGTGHRSDDDLDGDVMTRSDVIRAEDKAEEDLPEQGFTKSLLAQWKQKEIESTYSRDSSPHSTSSQQTWNSNRRTDTHRRPPKKIVQTPDSDISSADEHAYENIPPRGGGMNGDMEGSEYSGSVREVIRESDRNDEDELPPPSFTKNMLAKFQSMQEEATRDTYVRPPVKKQFKWTVRETKPLHTVTTTTTKREQQRVTRTFSNNSETAEYQEYEEQEGHLVENNVHDAEEYREIIQADFRADEVLEEDLPPSQFTRTMLAKFRSMEDVEQEPPTPEFSSKKMKAAIMSVSPSHTRRFEGGPVPLYQDGESPEDREQQLDNHHHQYDFDYNAAIDAGEYENDPSSNPDVIREGDVLTEDLPEQGTTRHLLAKFQSMQAS